MCFFFYRVCKCHHNYFRTFSSPEEKTPGLSVDSLFTPKPPPAAGNQEPIFCFSRFVISGVESCNHVLSFCVWLPLFSMMFSRCVHVVAYASTSFLFWLNDSPLCGSTTFGLSIHQLMDTLVALTFLLSWMLSWHFSRVQRGPCCVRVTCSSKSWLLLLVFFLAACKACGILGPQSEIKPAPPAFRLWV